MSLPVTVIIVSFNTVDLLRQCILSVRNDVDEVVVVDNASRDGSAEMVRRVFPDVQLIENEANLGFGAANNQGLAVARNDVVLLLNSDARAKAGAIGWLLSEFEDPTVVAVGGKLVFSDGHAQQSCCSRLTLWRVFCEQIFLEKLLPFSRVTNGYWLNRWLPVDRSSDVEQVMGACLMMRKVEHFDERFFLYCEDTELCRRLQKRGRIRFVPSAVFEHKLGGSSDGLRWWSVAMYNRGKELYFGIHHSRFQAVVCLCLNRLGAALRLVVWLVVGVSSILLIIGLVLIILMPLLKKRQIFHPFRQVALFARVLFAPISGPVTPPS